MLEDQEILALFFDRSEQAIRELAEKYGAACRCLAKNILRNEQDAAECVNDAYLAAWNTIPPERPKPLKTYLLRLVRNISTARYHANTALKRNSYYDVALEELEGCLPDAVTVEETLAAAELSRQINRFLDGLDPDSRVLFVRRYWYADSIPDIAARFHISNNHVSVRLSRIRDKLKKHLQKEGYIL